jgi:hypothetical protein
MRQRSAHMRASRRAPPLSRLIAVVLAALLLCTASPSAHALLFARQPPKLTLALAALQCITHYQHEVLAPAVARALGVGAQACLRPADVLDERAAKRGVWRVHMPPLRLLWSPALQLHAVTAGALHACCVISFVLKGAQLERALGGARAFAILVAAIVLCGTAAHVALAAALAARNPVRYGHEVCACARRDRA